MLLCHPRQEIKPITREERLLSKQFDPSNLFHRYLASPNSIYDFWWSAFPVLIIRAYQFATRTISD